MYCFWIADAVKWSDKTEALSLLEKLHLFFIYETLKLKEA